MKCEDKRQYSKIEAQRRKKMPHFKKKFRVYWCPSCGFWHLTSQN